MVNYQEVGGYFTINNLQDLDDLVPRILEEAGDHKIWLFEGAMGSGKTTLIQTICRAMGVLDIVSSPTYALVQEYRNQNEEVFYHFDFYRLKKAEEALDIGCDEYFDSGDLCFIEWGSQIEPLLPDGYIKILISVQSDESRKIVIQKHG